MDTLVIVRKIREAEALADAGKHGEARRLLEPLLSDDGVSESQRKLVGKKIDLFKKQHERMTRIISRRATSTSVRVDESNQSSERTAIRKAVGDHERSERPTDHTPDKEDPTERPTNRTIEKQSHGAPTEVVPRAHNVDTEVPERGHRLKVERSTKQTSGMWDSVSDRREVVRPPDPSDSQELAPVASASEIDDVGETDESDPRKTDMFVIPADTGADDSSVTVAPDDDSAPAIGRYNVDRPVYATGNDTPAPGWNDTPVPSSNTPAPSVRDSFIIPDSDTVSTSSMPDHDDDSTYLLADDYFASRPSARQRERSNPELKALADRLPDDDLRRELALEVVRLREQLEQSGSTRTEVSKREGTRTGSRKIEREDRPESGSFHIPASQVNTIVRRAAGTDRIEVHMPGRDEDAAELQVLRRDSVREKKAPATPTDRIALAQDYIEATQIEKPGLLKPVATWLGVLVILGVIGWAIHLGYQSIVGGNQTVEVTESSVGEFKLGSPKSDYEDVAQKQDRIAFAVKSKRGWLIQYDDESQLVTGVVVPGPTLIDPDESGFNKLHVTFNGYDYAFVNGASLEAVRNKFGKPTPDFSQETWNSADTYTLAFIAKQGQSALEVCYRTSQPDAPIWVRLVTGNKPPRSPTEGDFLPDNQ
ncbi:MAG: hypothetical protein KDB68_07495 [Planctomycetes bacterium]|nr:hypothetical protein [Planctomycetota bacterium]